MKISSIILLPSIGIIVSLVATCIAVNKKSNLTKKKSITHAIAAEKGWRSYMEDFHYAGKKNGMNLWMVCDGHAGDWVAKKLKNDFPKYIFYQLANIPHLKDAKKLDATLLAKIKNTLYQACINFDKQNLLEYAKKHRLQKGGSTLTMVLCIKNYWIFVNVGDSRSVYSVDGKVKFATEDHKPDNEKEKKRIGSLGGKVVYPIDPTKGVPRVLGFALSRAFGDFIDAKKIKNDEYQPGLITAEPDITAIEKKRELIILASDGLWDVMTAQQAVGEIQKMIKSEKKLYKVAREMINIGIKSGSLDNITCILIQNRS